jgi:hypothetical protein
VHAACTLNDAILARNVRTMRTLGWLPDRVIDRGGVQVGGDWTSCQIKGAARRGPPSQSAHGFAAARRRRRRVPRCVSEPRRCWPERVPCATSYARQGCGSRHGIA